MSLARLLNTRNLILHFTGADKAEVFENAVAEGKSNTDHPIRAFALQDKHDLEIFFAP
jgi:6-phosphogluconolactonase/glucosamine-6-phosphate isomerase/deaminase